MLGMSSPAAHVWIALVEEEGVEYSSRVLLFFPGRSKTVSVFTKAVFARLKYAGHGSGEVTAFSSPCCFKLGRDDHPL